MNVVICDASPLIILAKMDRLELIFDLVGESVVVLDCVARELLCESAAPHERERLVAFLGKVTRLDFEGSHLASRALSRSDQSTLTWAIQNRASWLIADDRLVRRVARQHGVLVAGFLGIVAEAARRRRIPADEARAAIDRAIAEHGCRISIPLYRHLMAELRDADSPR